jgi:anti-sigma factor RsiW
MTCREFVDFLIDYDSGELPEAQRAPFDEHLVVCPPCIAYLETYRETVALGKAAFQEPDDPLPDEVPEALVRAILTARSQSS